MNSQKISTRGRPKEVRPDLLHEAAIELFQLNGYENTSVEEIAKISGYSRATFFNCFPTKADVLWQPVDEILAALEHDTATQSISTLEQLHHRIDQYFAEHGPPWIFGNFWLIGNQNELLASGAKRLLSLKNIVTRVLASDNRESMIQTAEILAAIQAWLADGVNRKSFSHYLQ